MSESSERDDRHKARMQRKKALIDEKIAEAQAERGVVLHLLRDAEIDLPVHTPASSAPSHGG